MSRQRTPVGVVLALVAGVVVSVVGPAPAGAAELTQHDVPPLTSLWGVDCRADATCMGVGLLPGSSSATVVLSAGGVGPVRQVPGTDRLNDVECLPAGNCLAVGSGRRGAVVAHVAADGTPTAVWSVVGATTLFDIACPTASTCLAVGERVTVQSTYPYNVSVPVYVVFTNGVPAPAQRFPRGVGRTQSVDCPTATRCVGVGSGHVAVLDGAGGSWTATVRVPPGEFGFEAISCSSPTLCHASAHEFLPFGAGVLGVPAIVPVSADGEAGPVQVLTERSGTVYGISCVPEGTCTIVGRDNALGRSMVLDVRPGQPPAVTFWDQATFYAVSCVGLTGCGLVGQARGAPQRAAFAWKA